MVWGTMIPTNPINPLTETAAAVARVAAITTTIRTRSTSTPSPAGLLVTDPQHVEHPSEQDQDHCRQHGVGQENSHFTPTHGDQTTEYPGVNLAQGLVVLLEYEGLDRSGEGSHRNAGEDQRGDAPPPSGPPHRIGHQHCGEASNERDWWNQRRSAACANDESRPQTSPGGDTQEIWVGERVAEDSLVTGAGHGEDRAHDASHHNAGQSELEQKTLLDLGQPVVDIDERKAIEQSKH